MQNSFLISRGRHLTTGLTFYGPFVDDDEAQAFMDKAMTEAEKDWDWEFVEVEGVSETVNEEFCWFLAVSTLAKGWKLYGPFAGFNSLTEWEETNPNLAPHDQFHKLCVSTTKKQIKEHGWRRY